MTHMNNSAEMDGSSGDSLRRKGKRRFLYILILITIIGLTILISRTPQISDALKGVITSELEDMTGKKVAIRNIYLNIFPLFIEAKDLRIYHEGDRSVLTTSRVKGYLGLSGLLDRRLSLNRIVIHEPALTADRGQLEEIIKNVKLSLIHI